MDETRGLPPPKKRFGQHFLKDKNVIRRIVEKAGVKEGDLVLEVGPGRGALTEALLDAGAHVVAIEVDRSLVEYLKQAFSGKKLDIIVEDALKVSFTGIADGYGRKLKAVSNLPYNISGPILAKFLEQRRAFTNLVLMFQKEVAQRIVAVPSTKEYGILSVFSQAFCDVKKEFDVSKNLFTPRPKVDSSIVSLKVLDTPRADITDEAFFKTVVRAAFGVRRKTLLNALKPVCGDKDALEAALKECAIDPMRRGETLGVQEFARLANRLLLCRA